MRKPTGNRNYDDCKQLTLADLKRYGLLVPMHQYSTTIRWTRPSTGVVTGSVGLVVTQLRDTGHVEVSYTYREEQLIQYQIKLVSQPSNLGKGLVWYFICPLTGLRCRTLYLIGKYFASHKATPEMLYESQTYSKHYRWLDKTFAVDLKIDRAFDELYKPNVKRHYRGKPTPKLKHLLKLDALSSGMKPLRLESFTTRRK